MTRVGIDLGGTAVKGALFGENNQAIKEFSAPTRKENREAIFGSLFAVADALVAEDTRLIGVSSAGNIDPERGVCVYATDNLPGWTGADIKTEVEARYLLPCRVDNDAVCALKGELSLYPDVKDATMLTFGTGVGGASLVGGKIVRGKQFDAARWGHLVLVPNGRPCNCGKRGCAERYLSATALSEQGKKLDPALADCRLLFARAAEGDCAAGEVLKEFGFYLNLLLDQIRTALAPEYLILGGGVARSQEQIRALLKKTDDVVFARLGNLAGATGAIL